MYKSHSLFLLHAQNKQQLFHGREVEIISDLILQTDHSYLPCLGNPEITLFLSENMLPSLKAFEVAWFLDIKAENILISLTL